MKYRSLASNCSPPGSLFLFPPCQLLSRAQINTERDVRTETPGSRWHFCPINSMSHEQDAMGKDRGGQSCGAALQRLQATVHPPPVQCPEVEQILPGQQSRTGWHAHSRHRGIVSCFAVYLRLLKLILGQ